MSSMGWDSQDATLPNTKIYQNSTQSGSERTRVNSSPINGEMIDLVDSEPEPEPEPDDGDDDEHFNRQMSEAIANSLRDSARPTTRANSEVRTTAPSELNECEMNDDRARRTDSDSDEQLDRTDGDWGGDFPDADHIPIVPDADRRIVWEISLRIEKSPKKINHIIITNPSLNISTSISGMYGKSINPWIEGYNGDRNDVDRELHPRFQRHGPSFFARFIVFNPDLKILDINNYDIAVDNMKPIPVLAVEMKQICWAYEVPTFDDGTEVELLLETGNGTYRIEVKRGLGDKDTLQMDLVNSGEGIVTNCIKLDNKLLVETFRTLEKPICWQYYMGLSKPNVQRAVPSTTDGGGFGGSGSGFGGSAGRGFHNLGNFDHDQSARGGRGGRGGNTNRHTPRRAPTNSRDRDDGNSTRSAAQGNKKRKEVDVKDEDRAEIRRARIQSFDLQSPSRVQSPGVSLQSPHKRTHGTLNDALGRRATSLLSSTPRRRRGFDTVKVEDSDEDDNNDHTENRSIRSGSRGLPTTAAKTSVPGGHIFPWANPGQRLGSPEEK